MIIILVTNILKFIIYKACARVLGSMLCLCLYTGTSLVPYRKLPSTAIMNTESSPVSTYSNLPSVQQLYYNVKTKIAHI